MSLHLRALYKKIKPDAVVLDVGCSGFRQAKMTKELGLEGIKHFGVDYCKQDNGLPVGFIFKQVDLNTELLPFRDKRSGRHFRVLLLASYRVVLLFNFEKTRKN